MALTLTEPIYRRRLVVIDPDPTRGDECGLFWIKAIIRDSMSARYLFFFVAKRRLPGECEGEEMRSTCELEVDDHTFSLRSDRKSNIVLVVDCVDCIRWGNLVPLF